MRARDDDVLLDALGRALRDSDAEPTGAEVAALHHAVAVGGAAQLAAEQRRARRRGWIAGLTAGAVLGLTGTAVAVDSGSVSVPAPVRDVAHGIGLPVDSRRLDDAKDAIEDLREDLDDRDRRKVCESATELRVALAALTVDERRSVQADADAVLGEADAFLATPVPTPTTPPPARSDNSGPGGGDRPDEPDAPDEPDEDRSGSGGGGSDDEDRSGSNRGPG